MGSKVPRHMESVESSTYRQCRFTKLTRLAAEMLSLLVWCMDFWTDGIFWKLASWVPDGAQKRSGAFNPCRPVGKRCSRGKSRHVAAASSSNARTMAELVAAVRATPGRFAVLAGAGISNSAGIMTGDDWLHAQAARDGLDTGLQPVAWYRETYGSFPNYFRMLHEAAGLRTVRDVLPREYFTSATGGDHQPTPSHRALAELAVTGRIGPILTTNFDRLLEKAIVEAGASPTVALSLDSFTEMSSSSLPNCLVVKLHGDYLDIKIRDTSPSIYTYHPIIDTLLDQ